ncbi:MAG: glutathione S-transferase family protein [Nannocystaceae bacterium]|nr:glutathione S-transferase family protein [bacterium]
MELLTIPFSHYNERARWAMQHHGLAAHERRYLPMLHFRPVRDAVPEAQRVADKTGSGLSTPVLVLDDGTVLTDSTRIVRWADETHGDETRTLYPAALREQIVAFEQPLHDDIGRDTRFLAYWFLLDDGPAFAELVRHNVGLWQRAAFTLGSPLAKAGMRKRFGLTQPRYEKVRARIEAAVAELSATLGDREYFFGDRFTAADLTAATMLSPALLPLPGYGARIPEIRGPYGELRDQLAATAVGRHARRMFERHRGDTPAGWTLG